MSGTNAKYGQSLLRRNAGSVTSTRTWSLVHVAIVVRRTQRDRTTCIGKQVSDMILSSA